MLKMWTNMFSEDDIKIVGQAVSNYILNDLQGFLPTIGKIKEEARKILYPDELTEQEAVNIIMAKLSWRSSKEAYDSLPPVLQKVVGSPSQISTWGYMELDTVQSVVASNIGRSLRSLLDKERQAQRTGQYQPYIKEQLETRAEPKQIVHQQTQEEKDAEREKILSLIANARKEVVHANDR